MMNHEQMLLTVAIVTFVLMLVGLILTVAEYKEHINPSKHDDTDDPSSRR